VLVEGGGGVLHGSRQRPLDLDPGGRAAGVHHPGVGVAALPGQLELPGGIPIEDRPEGDQLVDPGRALVDQHPHGVVVAQPGARRQRVRQVEVGRVGVAPQDGGDAALRPAGGGLVQLGLGQHPHPQAVVASRPDRGREPGDAGPQDQQVEGGPGGRQWAGTST
jgi:hypothetical protein